MPKRSTTTQLVEFYNDILKYLEVNNQYDVLYLDLSKAFDRVPHNLLLKKLKCFGYNGTLLNWFADYLSHRKQRVTIEGSASSYSMVTSGVPQGSILGPLLFNYYINDLLCTINDPGASIYLYADDAKVGYGIGNIQSCLKLQNVLNDIISWSSLWGMLFNVDKCVSMSFSHKPQTIAYNYTINGVVISRVNSFTDLGIIVNSRLKWDEHICSCIKKANQKLGLIKRVTGFTCSSDIKLLCYTAIVRPHLEYCPQVWFCNSKKLLLNIEAVQRKATKYILNDYASSYTDRLISLQLTPLSMRKDYLDIVFFYNCINGLIDINLAALPNFVDNSYTRTRLGLDDLLLYNSRSRYNLFDKFYTNRISKSWNCLPYNIRCLELTPMGHNSTFKNELKKYMFDHLCHSFDSSNPCTWVLSCNCFTCRP
jgi:hypothetical protein